jgi:hypothetical protein
MRKYMENLMPCGLAMPAADEEMAIAIAISRITCPTHFAQTLPRFLSNRQNHTVTMKQMQSYPVSTILDSSTN